MLAPAPELTVTVEQRDHRDEVHLHAGGQGFWVARLLVELGVPTTLAGSFGGETGPLLQMLIASAGVQVAAVEVPADNGAYVHDRRDGSRKVVARQRGEPLGRHAADELYSTALAAGLASGACVLGGSDPDSPAVEDDVYRRLAADLSRAGRIVVADLSGGARAAAADGGATLLKTSDEDLAADGELPADASLDDVTHAIDRIRASAEHVVVTRGDRPTIAWHGGRRFLAAAPRFEVLDHRGAGDSMTAGLTAALAAGHSLPDGLRLGVAAAALNVTRRGLGSGSGAAIRQAASEVTVEQV